MLTVDQFVGCGGGPLENWQIASDFSEKSES